MIPLRLSTTSQEIALGPFVDSTDGNTEETGLTIANTDIKLWKAGATTLANKNSGGGTHISNGIYYAVLDDTDTNTLGALHIFVHVSGALPIKVTCCVLPAVIYDSMIAGTDMLHVDLYQILETALTETSAGYLAAAFKKLFDVAAPVLTAASVNQTGDSYGRIGAAGAGLTALGDTRIANLDAAVSSRSTYAGADTAGTTTLLSRIASAITITSGKVDVNDKTGFSLSTAPPTAADIATAVWESTTRTLSSFGTLVADIVTAMTDVAVLAVYGLAVWGTTTRSLTDKAGFTISGTKQTLDSLNDISAANVLTQVNAALDADTAELSAVPTASSTTLRKRINAIYQYFFCKRTATVSTETLYKSDSSTALGTATLSDNGVTASHGKVT